MKTSEIKTIGEYLHWAYANLAMAHSAVKNDQTKYKTINYMIRAKLFKGLQSGTMNMRSLFDDEKIKIGTGNVCNYCGSEEDLSLDHILSKKNGGVDNAENLVCVCRSCNSSKGANDLMVWMEQREKFLPLMVIRRYLKLSYQYCTYKGLLQQDISDTGQSIPYAIVKIPLKYPKPEKLTLHF